MLSPYPLTWLVAEIEDVTLIFLVKELFSYSESPAKFSLTEYDDAFLRDIAEKISGQKSAILLTVINDISGFFLVFKIDYSGEDYDLDD